jgi:hypothetical protein
MRSALVKVLGAFAAEQMPVKFCEQLDEQLLSRALLSSSLAAGQHVANKFAASVAHGPLASPGRFGVAIKIAAEIGFSEKVRLIVTGVGDMSASEERRGIADGKRDMTHRMDAALVEWLTDEAERFDRTRAWCIEHAVRMWKRRLERERRARKRRVTR